MPRLGLLCLGDVELVVLEYLQTELQAIIQDIFEKIQIIDEVLGIPKKAYKVERRQYLSPLFMLAIRNYAEKQDFDRILGITPVDLFVYELNFVFGQAEFGPEAKAAVISLYRLFPEFYGQGENTDLFLKRVLKEALHEIGHTLGLDHCTNNCIMIFSNSILDTDVKPASFCEKCRGKLSKAI